MILKRTKRQMEEDRKKTILEKQKKNLVETKFKKETPNTSKIILKKIPLKSFRYSSETEIKQGR